MDTLTPRPTLYLRSDGTLMLARGDNTIEMALTPAQLLQIGVDSLRVAVELQPACLAEVLRALDSTMVQVPVAAPEPAECIRLN